MPKRHLVFGFLLCYAAAVSAQQEDHAFMGVTGHSLNAEEAQALGVPGGAQIDYIYPGGAADQAGLLRSDVIVSCQGEPLVHFGQMARHIFALQPGATVQVGLLRAGESIELEVELGSFQSFNARIGFPAPPLRVDSWIGEELTLAELRGEVVVVVFWSMQSILWKISAGQYDKLATEYGERVRFIGVHVANEQFDKQTPEAIAAYLEKTPFKGAVALASGKLNAPPDQPKGYPLVQQDFIFERLPAVAAIDRDGNFAYRGEGSSSLSEVRAALDVLLSGEDSP